MFYLILTTNTFYLFLTTKTFYSLLTSKTFYSLLTSKTFYFSKTTAATYVRTHSSDGPNIRIRKCEYSHVFLLFAFAFVFAIRNKHSVVFSLQDSIKL